MKLSDLDAMANCPAAAAYD